jgi:small basic protein
MLPFSFCIYILLPILKLQIGMLNKELANPAHPVSFSLYLCLKIKKGLSSIIVGSSAYYQQHHRIESHRISSTAAQQQH